MKILFIPAAALCLLVLAQAVHIAMCVRGADRSTKPFEQARPSARLKILFLGDSTAVGVGSAVPATSTAGWMGRDFPGADIENISQNGLKLAGLREKLKEIKGGHYDLVVLQIGANDIIRLTPLDNVERNLMAVLEYTGKVSKHTVMLHCADVGAAPIFTWPFNRILSARSYQVRKIYQKAAQKTGALYVDLIAMGTDNVFTGDRKKYYSSDGLHLSGEGYRVWYQGIRQTLEAAGVHLKD